MRSARNVKSAPFVSELYTRAKESRVTGMREPIAGWQASSLLGFNHQATLRAMKRKNTEPRIQMYLKKSVKRIITMIDVSVGRRVRRLKLLLLPVL
jgi:hypothetical protein